MQNNQNEQPVAQKQYSTIVIDPPWNTFQTGVRGAARHYGLMTLKQIEGLPVASLAKNKAHCWIWTTNNTLRYGFDIMDSWGFPVKSVFTWIKLRMGLGNYLRNCTEHLLLGVRGNCPVLCKNQINFGVFPVQDHSHKPEEVHKIIERVSPGPYLEMFARRRPKNPEWDVWGDEIISDVIIPGYPVPKYSEKAFHLDNTDVKQKEV